MSFSCVQLSITAEALKPRRFGMSKSNPFAILYIIGSNGDEEYLSRTEVSQKTAYPDWLKLFLLKYELGSKLTIKVAIYDLLAKIEEDEINIEEVATDKSQYRYIGSERFNVNKILEYSGNYLTKTLTGKRGSISLCAEKTNADDKLLSFKFQFRAMGLLSNKSFSSRMAHSYFEISRKLESKNGEVWDKVYRSETIKNHMNPVWKHANIDVRALCNNDFKRPIRVQVFEAIRSGKHAPLGAFESNLEKILASKSIRGNADLTSAYTIVQDDVDVGRVVIIEAQIRTEVPFQSVKRTESSSEDNPANISIDQSTLASTKPTFQDYRFGGCHIDVSVAIDFSSHNDPDSLHKLRNYKDGGVFHYSRMNEYQKAILDVGTILGELDTNNMKFSVYGLGIRENDTELQLFQCGVKKEVTGIGGILEAYKDVRGGGFTPSDKASLVENINMAARKARHIEKRSEGRLCYSILLVLTVGEIINVKETKDALVDASTCPLSVIFVGIGNKRFRKLKEISTDHTQNASFVDFHQNEDKKVLTDSVLERLPGQVVDYFWDKGISPHDM